jgi:hypothetical protein
VITSYATIRTTFAIEYLAGLGRAWHRVSPVSDETPRHVEIPFPIGQVSLDADGEILDITLTASTSHNAALLEDLISEHLDRLSLGEDLRYQWLSPNETAAKRQAFKIS